MFKFALHGGHLELTVGGGGGGGQLFSKSVIILLDDEKIRNFCYILKWLVESFVSSRSPRKQNTCSGRKISKVQVKSIAYTRIPFFINPC